MQVFKGEKVTLRSITTKDYPAIHSWINHPEVAKYWYGKDKPRTLAWFEQHIRSIANDTNPCQSWMIEVEGTPIGFMYNTQYIHDDGEFTGRVELDILIGDTTRWGKGYGTDALVTLMQYVFSEQRAERIFLTPRIINKRAIHVYEKAGFKKEGVLRHFEKFEGEWVDCIMMSILSDEFKKKSKPYATT